MSSSPATACPVCGRPNAADALFCAACIAPLRVQKLADLASDDLQLSIDNLLEVLLRVRQTSSVTSVDDDDLLDAYLQAFWLRPETALLQFCECRLVAPLIERFADGPLVDIGCGNGVHTSLLAGWRFDPAFDVFADVDLSATDIYNVMPRESRPVPIARRGRTIDYGIDIKPAMVEQARRLGTFKQSLVADALNLPMHDGEVACIYSNVLRDFDQTLDPALLECRRILKPHGRLILISPTETYQEKLFYFPRASALKAQGQDALADRYQRLDRGRSIFCRQQVPLADWQARLARCGFELEQSLPFASQHVLEFWDTGLRPFSPQLIGWANSLRDHQSFATVKQGFLALLRSTLHPLAQTVTDESSAAFRVLLAKKT